MPVFCSRRMKKKSISKIYSSFQLWCHGLKNSCILTHEIEARIMMICFVIFKFHQNEIPFNKTETLVLTYLRNQAEIRINRQIWQPYLWQPYMSYVVFH